MTEAKDDAEWAVIRLRNGELLDIKVLEWEQYLRTRPETRAIEVCRRLTKTDAENLTLLGNKQREMEK